MSYTCADRGSTTARTANARFHLERVYPVASRASGANLSKHDVTATKSGFCNSCKSRIRIYELGVAVVPINPCSRLAARARARGSSLAARGSWIVARARGSWLVARARGSRLGLVARGSWLVARGSCSCLVSRVSCLVARGSWLVARGSWLVARGSRLVLCSPAGPDAPHVGFKTAGKRRRGESVTGHIILETVPAGRPPKP